VPGRNVASRQDPPRHGGNKKEDRHEGGDARKRSDAQNM
jgi:hypothetical protein